MDIKESDLKIETMRGTGPGGQHRNKTDSACRITHIPTGICAYADERSQRQSKRLARKELIRKIEELGNAKRAEEKKAGRDYRIHNTPTVRTYHFPRQTVKDHRTGKTASLKEVLAGKLSLVHPDISSIKRDNPLPPENWPQ